MSRLTRAERDATGATSIRLTQETRGWLVYLLHREQQRRGSKEHERGGRQFGKKAAVTIDDVVYELAMNAVDEDSRRSIHAHAGSLRSDRVEAELSSYIGTLLGGAR